MHTNSSVSNINDSLIHIGGDNINLDDSNASSKDQSKLKIQPDVP